MTEARVPGLSVVVSDHDGPLFAKGYGWADVRHRVRATQETSYLWFSMTKVATATAVLRLADLGIVDLDATVNTYLPWLVAPGPRQPRVRDLLDHTSGLANPFPLRWVQPAAAGPGDGTALLRRLSARRTLFRHPVGVAPRYSNVGYLAAGAVLEAATGENFCSHLSRAVLRPAGLTATGFEHSTDATAATGYLTGGLTPRCLLAAMLPSAVVGGRYDGLTELRPFYVMGPAFGGLVGDVLGVGRFLQAHLREGDLDGVQLWPSGVSLEMQALTRTGRRFQHGPGWFRRPGTPPGSVEHLGSGAGFSNLMQLHPRQGIGIAIMANCTRPYDTQRLCAALAEYVGHPLPR